ncbi:MAG: hypothetical protein CL748_05085 [Chloroflexi bacterium]|nr:hypothetical protein [Chloroflexota bacterium]MBA31879.1 hypothetical protein [Chloroflexota bacterium]|tara:strand:+ start:506 stop:1195 length:690 start_codon:yes stop_codon:yes gene_type:complete
MQNDSTKINLDRSKIFCTHCGVENGNNDYGCGRCGEKLIKQTDVEKTSLNKIICNECENFDYVNSFYCWSCGVEFTPENKKPFNEPLLTNLDNNDNEKEQKSSNLEQPNSSDYKNNNSGDKKSDVPKEIKGWNWAAFLIPPLWGLFSGVPIAIIMLGLYLPIFSDEMRVVALIVCSIFLGFRGNELAWKGKKWKSVEHFKNVQKKWLSWAVTLNIIYLIFILYSGNLSS